MLEKWRGESEKEWGSEGKTLKVMGEKKRKIEKRRAGREKEGGIERKGE